MAASIDLKRFIEAQQRDYETALAELTDGRKRGHWMWYVFPQVNGLGFSSMSQRYAIRDLKEAQAYLTHPVLGPRLLEISTVLLQHTNSATQIFGSPDDMKLRSSMTLFSTIPGSDNVFQEVLDHFFQGKPDQQTLTILNRQG
jgi:uncharacterized protein (DUF1810 family)